jgi:hypothetical protein
MATTTPNFGWPVPTSTDLVKDGATAIESLGDSIDASLLDLKGGTSGQVLSKNSNTDMDFTWVTSDDANAIQNAIVDAKGDLITATAADTPARLAVGTNGQVLTADSTAGTGLKWATPASGGMTLLSTTTTNTGSTYTISSISQDYVNLQIIWQGLSCTAGAAITLTFAGSNASIAGVNQDGTIITANAAAAKLMPDTQSANNTIACTIFGYTVAACKTLSVSFGGLQAGYRGGGYLGAHFYDQAISTFTVTLSTGSFSAGSLKVYGVK